MTAHFVPYLEGCSLASTIIGTALRELLFSCAYRVMIVTFLLIFLLTVVVSGRSILAYEGHQYVSVRRIFPYPMQCD